MAVVKVGAVELTTVWAVWVEIIKWSDLRDRGGRFRTIGRTRVLHGLRG